MANKFKAGDRVRLLGKRPGPIPGRYSQILPGEVYTVDGVDDDGTLNLAEEGTGWWFSESHFELVEAPKHVPLSTVLETIRGSYELWLGETTDLHRVDFVCSQVRKLFGYED